MYIVREVVVEKEGYRQLDMGKEGETGERGRGRGKHAQFEDTVDVFGSIHSCCISVERLLLQSCVGYFFQSKNVYNYKRAVMHTCMHAHRHLYTKLHTHTCM